MQKPLSSWSKIIHKPWETKADAALYFVTQESRDFVVRSGLHVSVHLLLLIYDEANKREIYEDVHDRLIQEMFLSMMGSWEVVC